MRAVRSSQQGQLHRGLDPSFAITINSKKVQVLWATDPLAMWREGIGNNKSNESMSKLMRAEVPLRRHGRVPDAVLKMIKRAIQDVRALVN